MPVTIMLTTAGNIEDVARLIQLAVAPIFLLAAVATTLMILTGRLARIVDRGRALEIRAAPDNASHREELVLLERRARLIYHALSSGVSAAIIVSLLMTTAFLGEMLRFNAAKPVALLFIGALFVYTGALMCFLREVFLAIGSFRLGIRPDPPPRKDAQAH